jgi:hypothetical protein
LLFPDPGEPDYQNQYDPYIYSVAGSGRNAMIMYKAAADYTDYFVYQP